MRLPTDGLEMPLAGPPLMGGGYQLDRRSAPTRKEHDPEGSNLMTPVFSPEEIRKVLLNAGLLEHESGATTGFYIGDGRESRGEILVEPRRASYGTGHALDWTAEDTRVMNQLLRNYLDAVVAAGYTAEIDMRMVVITEKAAPLSWRSPATEHRH